MLESPDLSDFSPEQTVTEDSARNDPGSFQKEKMPTICDVLFTQTSFDLGHLQYLEYLLDNSSLPLQLVKATLKQIQHTSEFRQAYLTQILSEIELAEVVAQEIYLS